MNKFDHNDAVQQAPINTKFYMERGVVAIDTLFKKGYAAEHPELLIAFMDICERDFKLAMETILKLDLE